MAFPAGWTRRCPLVIQHGQVPANQTSFPVLITNASGCLPAEMVTLLGPNSAQTDGGDIRFSSDLAGTTQLACEIVVWTQNVTSSAAVAEIWVPVSVLTGSDVTIYVWYNAGGGLSQPAASSTFGSQHVWDSNYGLVAHLPDGTSLTANDSTSNATNGTVTAATATAGKIDGGAAFVAVSSAQIDFGVHNVGTTAFTASAWFKASSAVGTFFTQWANSPASEECFIIDQNGGSGKARYDIHTNTADLSVNGATNICDGNWHYLVLVWPSAANTMTGYLDGAVDATLATTGTTINNPLVSKIWLGRYTNGLFYTGSADEPRISNIARSANWIATEYNNQNAPGSFIIAGSPSPVGSTSSLFRITPMSGLGTGGPFFSNPLG